MTNFASLFSFSIGTLVLIVVWQYYKKTSADAFRDQLFDLRDEVREYFLKSAHGLESDYYIRLRTLLNGYLLFTEKATFGSFIGLCLAMAKNPEVAKLHSEEIRKAFITSDQDLQKFINNVRLRARNIIFLYMADTSALLNIVALVFLSLLLPLLLVYMAYKKLHGAVIDWAKQQINIVARVIHFCASIAAFVIAGWRTKQRFSAAAVDATIEDMASNINTFVAHSA